jgi:hypothetical protein
MKTQGPTTYTIPAQRVTSCGICEYHKCIGALCTRIGPGGWREYACMHPEAFEPVTDGDPEIAAQRGELRGMLKSMAGGGRIIGKTEATPDWCPFLRGQNTKTTDAEAKP